MMSGNEQKEHYICSVRDLGSQQHRVISQYDPELFPGFCLL